MNNWVPFPKQALALSISPDTAFEVLFGGARGPGKTDAGIQWLHGDRIGKLPDGQDKFYIHHPQYRALVLRKNYDDLVDWIDRASFLYKYANVEVVGKPAEIRWPSGAKFRLGHLKDRSSYEKYLGHEYHRLLIEELTLIPQEKHYIQILGSLRTTVKELKPQVFITTNPGGVGHLWVKERFIDPAPYGQSFSGKDGRTRIYIPGTIEDNPILMQDKGYLLFLEGLKDTDIDLYKAWRHGDWNIFAGQYFKEFKQNLHTTGYFEPKDNLPKFGGADWGHSPDPFVFLGAALEKVEYLDSDLNEYKFNRLWIYREVDGTEKTPHEWAREIKEKVNLKQFNWIRGDPQMNIKAPDGSRSILDQFREEEVIIQPANNDRINGWVALRNWLSIAPDGLPYLIIGEQCNDLIKTLPSLVHDENNVEDVDTDGPDHWADALRYMIIHLKWIDARAGGVMRPQQKKVDARHAWMLDPSKFVK